MTGNGCPQNLGKADNLGHQLRKSGLSFVGYAESLPNTGFRGCGSGRYLRKHNPWATSARCQQAPTALSATFPRLQQAAHCGVREPDMCHDMHDCSIRTGDRWMKKHFGRYARWAQRNNSLLIVTFDENAGGSAKSIPTIIVGANVRRGSMPIGSTTTSCFALWRTYTDCLPLAARSRFPTLDDLGRIANSRKPSPSPVIYDSLLVGRSLRLASGMAPILGRYAPLHSCDRVWADGPAGSSTGGSCAERGRRRRLGAADQQQPYQAIRRG